MIHRVCRSLIHGCFLTRLIAHNCQLVNFYFARLAFHVFERARHARKPWRRAIARSLPKDWAHSDARKKQLRWAAHFSYFRASGCKKYAAPEAIMSQSNWLLHTLHTFHTFFNIEKDI